VTAVSRVLALDYGRARCGCAISDPTRSLVTPLEVVERPPTRRGMAAIRRLVDEHGAGLVVVGLPLTMDGAEGAQAAETRAFADRLAAGLSVPVELYDERLTTRQAARTGAGGASAPEDSVAAAHLLEGYLAGAAAEARGDAGDAPPDPGPANPTSGAATVSRR
jgi:putative Holliday junction resolvase